jgi:CheY-like chemotaxis protein
MGGATGVASTAGVGSEFWVELPLTEPAVVSQQPVARDRVTASRAYSRAKTVLYVEDLVENVRLVEQILKQRPSVTLIPAMLAGVALDLARQHHPDLILLDLHLPDMPGEQVLQRLRADPATSDIPVVILSADATQRHMSQLMTVGADAYLTKPISVRGLLHAVDLAIGEAVTPAPRPPGQASRGDSHLSPAAPRHTSRGAATLAPQPHDTQAAER